MLGDVGDDPEPFLDALFEAWYELLAIGTIAVPGAATYDRMAKLIRSLPESEKPLVADIAERFPQVASLADGQPDFLHGVIDFSEPAPGAHMTIAAEELIATSVPQHEVIRKAHPVGRHRRRPHRRQRIFRPTSLTPVSAQHRASSTLP